MNTNNAKVILSKQNDKTQDDNRSLIGGSGLLDAVHDTIEKITEILNKIHDDSEQENQDDKVDFVKDVKDESGDCNLPVENFTNIPSLAFDVLNDDDFVSEDPVVEHFKNDIGGCKGLIKILKITPASTVVEKLSTIYNTLHGIRIAHRAQELGKIFLNINDAAKGLGASHQLIAVQKLEKLAQDSKPNERFALLKARDAVLEGTAQHLDAAGFRVRAVFSQYAPEPMVKTAYTNLETQTGDLIMLPQGKHQLGHPTTIELSKFRDHSVDAKIDPNTGDVTNGYLDFEKRRDNSQSARSRFEIHRNPVNDESLLTLAKDERSKPLTSNERNYEQRLDEDTTNRYNQKEWDKTREEALDKAKKSNLGHHGEPKDDESIASTLSKTAAKYNKIDSESEDTFGEQLSAAHNFTDGLTLEEMLDDERVGLTEDELDMLLEEWLEKSRKNEN
jgi:hypothetical protein